MGGKADMARTWQYVRYANRPNAPPIVTWKWLLNSDSRFTVRGTSSNEIEALGLEVRVPGTVELHSVLLGFVWIERQTKFSVTRTTIKFDTERCGIRCLSPIALF
jgi:hypothetical protein